MQWIYCWQLVTLAIISLLSNGYIYICSFLKWFLLHLSMGCPGGAREPACQCSRCKRHGFDLALERSSGGGNGNPLQYSHLENPKDRSWGQKELDMTEATWHACIASKQTQCYNRSCLMSLTSDPLICISGSWNPATSISQTLWPGGCKLFPSMEGTGRSCKGAEKDQPSFLPFLLLAGSQAVAAAVCVGSLVPALKVWFQSWQQQCEPGSC